MKLIQAEKLLDHLMLLPDVVARYANGGGDFPPLADQWLVAAETLLRNERLPSATEILAARTALMSARDRDKVAGHGGAGQHRRAEALAALDGLLVAERLLRGRVLELQEEVDAFEAKLVEAVTALTVLGALPAMVGRNEWNAAVWQALTAHTATRPTATWLSASLHANDRLLLLDRILARLRDSEIPALEWARGGSGGAAPTGSP